MKQLTTKVYQSTFTSPFEKHSKDEALKILDCIRNAFSKECGWIEISGYVEQLPNGKWRAVRHHAKYK